jgi:hypothetical protein
LFDHAHALLNKNLFFFQGRSPLGQFPLSSFTRQCNLPFAYNVQGGLPQFSDGGRLPGKLLGKGTVIKFIILALPFKGKPGEF